MEFLSKSGFLDTSSGDVRREARNCIVSVYSKIGNAVRPFLTDLRKKQVSHRWDNNFVPKCGVFVRVNVRIVILRLG